MNNIAVRLLSLVTLALPLAAAKAEPPVIPVEDVEKCAVATATPRMEAYGYTHVVELKNTCKKTVECEVWTDVDPQPRQKVTVKPGESDAVVTRRGSPASAFKAEKACRFSTGARTP